MPLDREAYEAFHRAILEAEVLPLHEFEKTMFFEGCLPDRGARAAARSGHPALRPDEAGRTARPDGRRPWAVVSSCARRIARSQFNRSASQSRMKWPDQLRVFRTLPVSAGAEFVRLGQIHRNTFINAPTHLDAFYRLRERPGPVSAGQITGVEGYLDRGDRVGRGASTSPSVRGERSTASTLARDDRSEASRAISPSPIRALPAGQHQRRPLRSPRTTAEEDERRAAYAWRAADDLRAGGSGCAIWIGRFLRTSGGERRLRPTVRAYGGDLAKFADFLESEALELADGERLAARHVARVDATMVRSFLAARSTTMPRRVACLPRSARSSADRLAKV
ncbi:MAG: FAD-dependent oxidoreductase [Thermoanaerobaculia bacterium]